MIARKQSKLGKRQCKAHLKDVNLVAYDLQIHFLTCVLIIEDRESKAAVQYDVVMAVSSCSSQKILSFSSSCSSFECRSDPDFSGSARFDKPRISAARVIGASTASFSGVSSLIFRFPPNFVRQLSTKARRNCSNIGVAQIVAASWSNSVGSGSNSAAAAAASAAPAPPAPVEITSGDDIALVDGLKNVQLEALADLKNEASFLSSDGSLAIHAGKTFVLSFIFLFSMRYVVIDSCF